MTCSAHPVRLGALYLLALLVVAGTTPAVAQSPNEPFPGGSEYRIVTLRKPGVILEAASGDMNGDGAIDLLLFHKPSKEAYEKSCLVYLRRHGDFPADNDMEIHLGEEISAVGIEDIDGDGKDELYGIDCGGLKVFWADSETSVEPERLLERKTILPSSSRRIIIVDWLADLNADGRVDVLFPVAEGLHLFLAQEARGFDAGRLLELWQRGSVTGESGQKYVTYRLPEIRFSDFDGDGHTDVGAFDFEQADFFLTGGSRLPERHVSAPLVTEFTKDFIGAADFRDLNADGLPEAVIMLVSQRKQLESEVRVYFCRKNLSYGDEPAHTFAGAANLIMPMFLDANGDGKTEMLLQNVHVGFGFFINYFLRNRIRVDGELWMLGENGRYGEEPVLRRAFYVQASESGTEPARGIGDFNGDGLNDLVVGTSEDRLSFYLSNEAEVLPRQPDFEIGVPAYGDMTLLNLNGDHRTDIVILYSQDEQRDLATVLLSN